MDFKLMLLNGFLKTLARQHPEWATAINLVIANEDKADELVAVVSAAVKEGGSAIEAARKAAPELEQAVRNLAATFPGHAPTAQAAELQVEKHTENALRDIAGVGHMDPEAERRWMDSTTYASSIGLGG